MKKILSKNNKYILRFDKGDEVIMELQKFCQKEKIKAGYFSGIGAAEEVTLSSYSLKKKRYFDKKLAGEIEIASLTGNVSTLNNKAVLHLHGVFSDEKCSAFAGHVKKVVISVTGEVIMEKIPGKVERKLNKKIGLNLLD